ncbi:MAG TPA: response regulator transcription factor [Ktedonosporobacter sp.]|nr:response regulator transcription factor [Ktedonosporobacter sp.]
MSEQKIRVALADDQRLLREGLRIILESAPDIVVPGEAEDGEAAIQLAATALPDVMLMDIRMPKCDGIAATRIIHRAHPNIRIMLLTTYDTPDLVIEGLRAGATGYLLKDCSAEELCSAIRSVARGQVLLQATSAAQLLAGLSPPASPSSPHAQQLGLTGREYAVLRLIVQGRNNSEIAKALYVGEATVKTHINHIFAKLGARDRAHAVVLAHQFSLVSP